MALVKVTRKYQITLPRDARGDIHVGDEVEVLRVGGEILVKKSSKRAGARGLWGLGSSLWKEVDALEYLEELRSEWKPRERRRWRSRRPA